VTAKRLLAYVEDAGAAVYLAPLSAAVAARGGTCRLIAGQTAGAQLTVLGIPFETSLPSALPQGLDAVVVGTSENPRSPSFDLVAKAQRAGIPTLGAVDGSTSAEHRFRGTSTRPLAHAPDWIIVPTKGTAQAFRRLGHPADKVVVCGHPHHDVIRRARADLAGQNRAALRRSLLPMITDDRPILTFLAEISDGLDPALFQRRSGYSLTGRGGDDRRTNIVLEEVLDAVGGLDPRPHVVLRLSPKNTTDEFTAYRAEVSVISQGGSPWPLLHVSDIVVGMSTTVLQESVLLARPTLSVLPCESEKAWLPDGLASLIPCITTRAALQTALKTVIGPDSKQVDAVFPPNAIGKLMNLIEQVVSERSVKVR
jgi:hypothetical protein